jgi:hypothetical protein
MLFRKWTELLRPVSFLESAAGAPVIRGCQNANHFPRVIRSASGLTGRRRPCPRRWFKSGTRKSRSLNYSNESQRPSASGDDPAAPQPAADGVITMPDNS